MVFGAHAARGALARARGASRLRFSHACRHSCAVRASGLPLRHQSYVDYIEPGMPLFLFNYTGTARTGVTHANNTSMP